MTPKNLLLSCSASVLIGLGSLAGCGGEVPNNGVHDAPVASARDVELPEDQWTPRITAAAGRAGELQLRTRAEPGRTPQLSHSTPTFERARSSAGVLDQLDRLRNLEVFEVGDAIRTESVENCIAYGGCVDQEIALSNEEIASRVGELADLAEKVALSSGETTVCENGFTIDERALQESLEVIAGLQVVEVGGLVRADRAEDAACYIGFCASDATNCARANVVGTIAEKLSR